MNTREFAKALSEKTGVPGYKIESVISAMPETIARTLKLGGTVQLGGVGIFGMALRSARKIRHPKTKKIISVKARRMPAMRIGTALKRVLD